jgi:hypothetical protein
MSSTPPAGASISFGYIFDNLAVTLYVDKQKRECQGAGKNQH